MAPPGSDEPGPTQPSANSESDDEWASFEVPAESNDERVDRLVTRFVPQVGRKLASKLCRRGDVLVQSRPVKKSHLVQAGQVIWVRLSAWGVARPAPQVPLHVVLEQPNLVVVTKQPGTPTGAIVGHEDGTLAGALLARYPEIADVGYSRREPGVLHRLDNFTSGLVVAARNTDTFDRLRRALIAGSWTKRYLALVDCNRLPTEGFVDATVRPDPDNVRRVVVDTGPSKMVTHYVIKQRGKRCDLVELRVSVAYRHQIRAHLASIGAPLLGDALYGGTSTFASPRHALHASYVSCDAGEAATFVAEAPLPEDLATLLED